jgi:hypothetical protein
MNWNKFSRFCFKFTLCLGAYAGIVSWNQEKTQLLQWMVIFWAFITAIQDWRRLL